CPLHRACDPIDLLAGYVAVVDVSELEGKFGIARTQQTCDRTADGAKADECDLAGFRRREFGKTREFERRRHGYATPAQPAYTSSPTAETGSCSSGKKCACSACTARTASLSSITKLMLISEAPCETMWMLTFALATAWKTSAQMPMRPRMLSPTRQTIALPLSTSTTPSGLKSFTSAFTSRDPSIATETLTSEVFT